MPIRYLNTSSSQAVLAGLYRTAHVGVVRPLSDGMNLVAKEYVAAQDRNDPGVLVLSKFAGAAQELEEALLIDPCEPGDIERALWRAISMPLEERRTRWEAMMNKIRDQNIHKRSANFVGELERSRPARLAEQFNTADAGAPRSSKWRKPETTQQRVRAAWTCRPSCHLRKPVVRYHPGITEPSSVWVATVVINGPLTF
ncbi:trehalose-6-phosphate synthase [Bradyrhizobium genosp. P]|uniref:trehalose-6-phosphate synthase n=1 Tax=Bradyrhizobium genosp. P TaxID=83641 RepID=UPI003CEF0E27